MIMAIGNEVPILHCPFAECGRKRQMINDMGLSDRLVDIDSTDAARQMFHIFSEVVANLAQERQRLRQIAAWLESLATKTIDNVRAILREARQA